MTIHFLVSGADASGLGYGFSPPISDGLIGWWWLGGSEALSRVNHASLSAAPAIASGSITYHAGFASFAGGRLTTDLVDRAALTIMAVARTPTDTVATAVSFAGYWGAGPLARNYGPYLGVATDRRILGHSSFDHGGVVRNTLASRGVVANPGKWRLLATTTDNAAGVTIHDLTDGVSTSQPDAEQRALNNQTMQIGNAPAGSFGGACDVACVLAYGRVLSAAERAQYLAYFQAVMRVRNSGITV